MHEPPARRIFPIPHAADTLTEIRTDSVRHALSQVSDRATIADLLFLETWKIGPISSIAATLRAAQIRRANPKLAKQLREEAQHIRANSSRHADALHGAAILFSSIHET